MENIRFCGISNACLKTALIIYLFISATCANIYVLSPNQLNPVLALGLVFYAMSVITCLITIIHHCCLKYYSSDDELEQI